MGFPPLPGPGRADALLPIDAPQRLCEKLACAAPLPTDTHCRVRPDDPGSLAGAGVGIASRLQVRRGELGNGCPSAARCVSFYQVVCLSVVLDAPALRATPDPPTASWTQMRHSQGPPASLRAHLGRIGNPRVTPDALAVSGTRNPTRVTQDTKGAPELSWAQPDPPPPRCTPTRHVTLARATCVSILTQPASLRPPTCVVLGSPRRTRAARYSSQTHLRS